MLHVNNSLSGRVCCFFLASRLTIVSLDVQNSMRYLFIFTNKYVCMYINSRDGMIHDLHVSMYCLLSIMIRRYIAIQFVLVGLVHEYSPYLLS